ncbi:hypothetical protein [Streptococcus sp. zg-JUN1979]|uniref:hypothetical protein n=1 Tax=Streptococcus sp. zg-JUN1979 TaxID=3391450 RepID=UPI0039A4999F
MAFKDNVKTRAQKLQKSMTKNWKKTLLFSAAFLAVGGAGVMIGSRTTEFATEFREATGDSDSFMGNMPQEQMGANMSGQGDGYFDDRDEQNSTSYHYETTMTYDEWTKAVNNSSLSSEDKKTFLAALEKTKDNINKVASLNTEWEKLYTDNFYNLESEFSSLMSKHKNLWAKIDEHVDSLGELDTDDFVDIKQAINRSSLSDSEKSDLLADLDSLKSLKEQYSKAYATYVEKSASLEEELRTAQNAIQTTLKDNKVTSTMLSEVFGGGHDKHRDFDDDDHDSDDDNDWF